MNGSQTELKTSIALDVQCQVSQDHDVGWTAYQIAKVVVELLDKCDVREEDDPQVYSTDDVPMAVGGYEKTLTEVIVENYVSFVGGEKLRLSGSECDYATIAALRAFDGITVRVNDVQWYADRVVPLIKEYAVYPERELGHFEAAGMPLE